MPLTTSGPAAQPSRVAIILNPTAGRGAAGRALASIRRRISYRFHEVVYYTTRARGDGESMANEAIADGARLVVACGGDGTLHEVVNSVLGSQRGDVVLGLIPFGTGNDFARAVGLHGSLDAVIQALVTGRRHPIDVGEIEGIGLNGKRHFLVAAGVGFVADTARTVNEGVRGLSGPAAYVYGAVKTLRGFEPVQMRIRLDGDQEISLCAMLLSISNVATTGGGIRIAPDARPDDGLLDLCLVEKMSKGRLLQKLPAAFAGKHVGDASVRMMRARSIEVHTPLPCQLWIDGEVTGSTPARFRVKPGALTMMVPATYAPAGEDV